MKNTGRYIMVVDDNLKNLELTGKILKDEDYLVSLIQSGESALKQLEQLTPDIILLDIMMPGMDGLELCRLIKKNERFQEIPVIFLTAKDQTEDLALGFKAGGVDYITKPFRQAELLVRVKNHIELAASRRKIIEMNKSRDKLYSIIAHDIRSPFASISLAINSIANGYIETSGEEFIEIINYLDKRTSETMTLLDNLLTFGRLHGLSDPIAPVNSYLLPIINECTELLRGIASKKNIIIETDIREDLMAFFDELSFHAVYRNLLFKIIQSTRDNGLITVNAQLEDEFLCTSIRFTVNEGSGESLKKVITDSDHESPVSTYNESGGSLDSIIIRETIIKTGGRIEVISTSDPDLIAKVYLPLSTRKAKIN